MNVRQPGMGKSRTIDDQHRLRLMALLDGLVRENAVTKSRAGMDVDHRTLATSLESGTLSRRMRGVPDDTKRKLSRREMLYRLRRALSPVMWRRWRQRAESGFKLAFVSSH